MWLLGFNIQHEQLQNYLCMHCEYCIHLGMHVGIANPLVYWLMIG